MTPAADIAARLGEQALAVCRHYLSNGRRVGSYWMVGDVDNTVGRSMYVRLVPDGAGRKSGHWTDAATGDYGDLLDVIREAIPSGRLHEAIVEAEAFLGGCPRARPVRFRLDRPKTGNRSREARSLFQRAAPLIGSLAEHYLEGRGINPALATGLRFLSNCYCRPSPESTQRNWPALIAPVTDDSGAITAVHRIYLDPDGAIDERLGKAPLDDPKRSLGRMYGNVVRIGEPQALLVIAEGIENALSIRTAFPGQTVHAALTAGNLASYRPPSATRRLLIALDDDTTGRTAARALMGRSLDEGLSSTLLPPQMEDHNSDLRSLGLERYRDYLEPLITS